MISSIQQTTDTMVERKLNDVYSTLTIEIPFSMYSEYIENALDTLSNQGVTIDRSDMMENTQIMKYFERALIECVDDDSFEEVIYDCPPIHSIYNREIAEAERIRKAKKQEEERIRKEQEAARKALEATTLATIEIPRKHLKKAMAILQAANLVKDSS